MLKKNKFSPIALDIGSDSVKMLQMQKFGTSVSVNACGIWKFPSGMSENASTRREMTVNAIQELLRKHDFQGKWAASALNCSEMAIKNVRLPQMSEQKLTGAIRNEALERFGWDVPDDQLKYLKAGQVRQGTETREEVIMLAAKEDIVEKHLALLDEVGLKAAHIDALPVAVFRGFERFLRRQADENAVTVLADVGFGGTRVIVARGRQIVFIKHIDIGGRKFTDAVAGQFNLSIEEASDLRLRLLKQQSSNQDEAAVDPDQMGNDANSVNWTIHDAVRSEVEMLAKEIALCMRYCSVTFRGLRPKKILMTGGEAYDKPLLELLTENLGIECEVGRPLKGIDVSSMDFGSDRRGVLAEWAVTAGLAVRGLDIEHDLEVDNGQSRLSA